MANTTRTEARRFSRQHKNTAQQCRRYLAKMTPGTTEFIALEREAVDHETRAADWLKYANQ